MARLAGVDLPREKRVEIGLTYIYGIGLTRSQEILKKAGVNPDIRVKDLTDEQMMEIALLENLQREDLNAMEEAMAYKRLQQELNLTQEELSKKVGKSRSHVTNMMGLLTLPEEVKNK